MSVLDDFNRFVFDRARAKYARAQYDQMTHDDWVALVEGYKAAHNEAVDRLEAVNDSWDRLD